MWREVHRPSTTVVYVSCSITKESLYVENNFLSDFSSLSRPEEVDDQLLSYIKQWLPTTSNPSWKSWVDDWRLHFCRLYFVNEVKEKSETLLGVGDIT